MEAPHTPRKAIITRPCHEASTVTRTRFFNAFDAHSPGESLPQLIKKINFPYTLRTAEKWLKRRKQNPTTDTYRRPGKNRPGRPYLLSNEQLHALVDPKQNPIRNLGWESQIEYHHLPVSKRTLQTNLYKRTKKARRYKKARVRRISVKNKRERVAYGQEHRGKTVENFWQFVHFSDEAHIDPQKLGQEYVLREQGTRNDPENFQKDGPKIKGK